MPYSSISDKIDFCIDCNDGIRKPVIAGRCKAFHYKQHRAKIQLEKQKERNKIRSLHSLQANKEIVQEKEKTAFVVDKKLEKWFNDRRKEMKGFCVCGCGSLSSKNDDKYFKFSAAHVLPKKNFKSLMYHPLNFIELSYWNGCHTVFDNMGYDYCKNTKPELWKIVVERFKILYPLIAPEEHKFIPDVLLETL